MKSQTSVSPPGKQRGGQLCIGATYSYQNRVLGQVVPDRWSQTAPVTVGTGDDRAQKIAMASTGGFFWEVMEPSDAMSDPTNGGTQAIHLRPIQQTRLTPTPLVAQ